MVDRCVQAQLPPLHALLRSTAHDTHLFTVLSKALSTTHPSRRPGTRRRAPRCGSRPSRPARIHCGMHSHSTASSSKRQGTSDRPHRQRQAVASAAAVGSATAAATARRRCTRACRQGTRRGTPGEWPHRSIPHSSIRSTLRIRRSRQYTRIVRAGRRWRWRGGGGVDIGRRRRAAAAATAVGGDGGDGGRGRQFGICWCTFGQVRAVTGSVHGQPAHARHVKPHTSVNISS